MTEIGPACSTRIETQLMLQYQLVCIKSNVSMIGGAGAKQMSNELLAASQPASQPGIENKPVSTITGVPSCSCLACCLEQICLNQPGNRQGNVTSWEPNWKLVPRALLAAHRA